jgi:hypothetical protein
VTQADIFPWQAEEAAHAPPASSLWRDLAQLPRMLFLRLPKPGTLTPGVHKLILAAPLLFLIFLAIEWDHGPGQVYWENLDWLLLPFAVLAFAAGLTRIAAGPALDVGRFWLAATLILLLFPLANAWYVGGTLHLMASGLPVTPLIEFLLVFPTLWLVIATARQALPDDGSRSGPPGIRVAAAYLVALCAVGGAYAYLSYVSPQFWLGEPPEEEGAEGEDYFPQIDESVLYMQPRLLDKALAAVAPGVEGKVELFFLGVGGEGQNVFLREVSAVEKLFAERYRTNRHSLILANNKATLQTVPLANPLSLGRALKRMGGQMNEEDVLFLFLTSHASHDFQFSFDFWPFRFKSLDPLALRRMLDAAGIKRKVIVVSACYSGGFIPLLKNENTLVITASAADRTSFGCSDENDFTDFGRAYFDEALRETRSFTQAYRLAVPRIAEREKTRQLPASEPQMEGGEALEEVLREIAGEEYPEQMNPGEMNPEQTPAPEREGPVKRAQRVLALGIGH